MLIKNVLMDANEGLYIDLTDIRARIDAIDIKHDSGTEDDVPIPIEETKYTSVLWGPTSIGSLAHFYAWRPCYYTLSEETVTYTETQNQYEGFFRGYNGACIVYEDYISQDPRYDQTQESYASSVYQVKSAYTAVVKPGVAAFDGVNKNSQEVEQIGIGSGYLGFMNLTSGTDHTVASIVTTADNVVGTINMSTTYTNTATVKVLTRHINESAPIIYTRSLPDGTVYKPTFSSYSLHGNYKKPYEKTGTYSKMDSIENQIDFTYASEYNGTYLPEQDIGNEEYCSISPDSVNLLNVTVRRVDGTPTYVENNTMTQFYKAVTTKITWTDDAGTFHESTVDDFAQKDFEGFYLSQQKTFDAYEIFKNADTVETASGNWTAKYPDHTGASQSDSIVPTNTIDLDTEMKNYYAKSNVETGINTQKWTSHYGVAEDNFKPYTFTSTAYWSYIPTYVYDSHGMRQLCNTKTGTITVNNEAKLAMFYFPVKDCSAVGLYSTYTELESTKQTGSYFDYGAYVRTPSLDRMATLRGVYVVGDMEEDTPDSGTYSCYYTTSSKKDDYNTAVNAKNISSYNA